jgi:DNA-binding SARP family transcriptional activator
MMQMNVNGPHKLEICLLGGFSAALDGETIPEDRWRLRKVKNMVKLLALAPNHQMHRDQLVELLWPDLDLDAALQICSTRHCMLPAKRSSQLAIR